MTLTATGDNQRRFFAPVAAMWLALPFIAYRYWSVWDRLPARMATHFAADGRPNGWMSPQQSLSFSLTLLAGLLIVFTGILLYAARHAHRPDATVWALLGLFYVVTATTTYICDAVLQYNLSRAPIAISWVAAILAFAMVVFLAIFIGARRSSMLPDAPRIAEEVHASPPVGLVFLVIAAAVLVAAFNAPIAGLKLSLSITAAIIAACGVMAWKGFRYVFTPAGVEIRTLGFRLRSIPAVDIESFATDRWTALGGYGIRGVGDTRAYVWSKTGVRIKLSDGEVFLGHKEPGRIIHDLDLVTNHKGHEGTQGM